MIEKKEEMIKDDELILEYLKLINMEVIAEQEFEFFSYAQELVNKEKIKLKLIETKLNDAIMLKIGEDHAKERRRQSKDTGVVALLYPPYTVSIDVSKKVEWDQLKIKEAASQIAYIGCDPLDYLDYKISIAEEKYKKLPGNIKEIVDIARIVKTGKPSPTIKPPKEDE